MTRTPTAEPGIAKRVGPAGTSYEVRVRAGARQLHRSFKTFQAAKDFKTLVRHQARDGSYVEPSREPLGSYLARWCDGLEARGRSGSTAWLYRGQLGRRYAALLDVPLGRLTPRQIEDCHVAALAAGLSAATVAKARDALVAALADAVRLEDLARNPAAKTTRPGMPARPLPVWTAAEAARFLAATEGARRHALWRFLLETGARIGEALALRWTDLDLAAAVVHVRRTQSRDAEDRRIEGERAKTDAGRRTIPLSPVLVARLRAARLRQEAGTPYVFPGQGGAMGWRSSVDEALATACRRAGVPRLSPHGLRHTNATLLIRAGVPVKTVSIRLGHRDVATTLRLYVHPDAFDSAAATEAIAGLLDGSRDKNAPISLAAARKPAP